MITFSVNPFVNVFTTNVRSLRKFPQQRFWVGNTVSFPLVQLFCFLNEISWIFSNPNKITGKIYLFATHEAILGTLCLFATHVAILGTLCLFATHEAILGTLCLFATHDAILGTLCLFATHEAILGTLCLFATHKAILGTLCFFGLNSYRICPLFLEHFPAVHQQMLTTVVILKNALLRSISKCKWHIVISCSYFQLVSIHVVLILYHLYVIVVLIYTIQTTHKSLVKIDTTLLIYE